MSGSMNVGRQAPKLPEQQTVEQAKAAIKKAADALESNSSKMFGKEYLVLRGGRLEVATLTPGEWLSAKFGGGGARLQAILTHLQTTYGNDIQNDPNLKKIIEKYLQKKIAKLDTLSNPPAEAVANAAKTVLSLGAFAPAGTQKVKAAVQKQNLESLLPYIKDAIKQGNKEEALMLLGETSKDSLHSTIYFTDGIELLEECLTLAKDKGWKDVGAKLSTMTCENEDAVSAIEDAHNVSTWKSRLDALREHFKKLN